MILNLKKKELFSILLAGGICTYLGFYNGFPLVTSDTGAYINNGFELFMPADRPLTYSLYLRLFALGLSLWLPVLLQGVLLSFLIYKVIQLLWNNLDVTIFFLPIIIFLTFFTSISWYCSQLTPDIFTPILFLALLVFMLNDGQEMDWIYLFIIFCSILMHNSNIVVVFLFAICQIMFALKKGANIRKSGILLTVSIAAILTMSSLHFMGGHGFRLSRSSHVFLIGKFSENGVLKMYLDTHCANNEYKICQYKESLPNVAWEFVWNENSPLYKEGGWENNREEYNRILNGILTSPKMLFYLCYKSGIHSLRQICQTDVGDGLSPHAKNTNTYWKVNNHYNHELPEYLSSKQNMGQLNWAFQNSLYVFIIVVSSIVVFVFRKEMTPQFKFAYGSLLLFIFFNAFVTANLANVLARLSSRAIWLLPMLNVIFLINYLKSINPNQKMNFQ